MKKKDDEIGRDYVKIAVPLTITASIVTTPLGGAIVGAGMVALGEYTRWRSQRSLAHNRALDEEERLLFGIPEWEKKDTDND